MPLVAVSTGKTLDAFGACFTKIQDDAGRAWAFAAADRGGSFTDEGASGVSAAYRLQVTKQNAGYGLRLYAAPGVATASVVKAVDQCR